MGWTNPMTWAANAVLTAAQLNTYLRDNVNYLRSNATAMVAISETTASGTYAALTTAGPAVTATTDVQALVILYAFISNSGAFQSTMGFDISGATVVAASDPFATSSAASGSGQNCSATFLVTGLTAGSNTFTSKYRVTGGTGTFVNRRIVVIPC